MGKTAKRKPTPAARLAALKKMQKDMDALDVEVKDIERGMIIHRVAIGAIPPEWAEKLLRPEHPEPKQGPQFRRAHAALRIAFPPDGHPPADLPLQTICSKVAKVIEKGQKPPSRDVIRRVLMFLNRRHAGD